MIEFRDQFNIKFANDNIFNFMIVFEDLLFCFVKILNGSYNKVFFKQFKGFKK